MTFETIKNTLRSMTTFCSFLGASWGGNELSTGKITSGALKVFGSSCIGALASIGTSEQLQSKTMQYSALIAAGAASIGSAGSTIKSVYEKNYWQALKSATGTLISGAATAAFALLPSEIVAKAQFSAAAIGAGSALAYKGVKDLLKGKVSTGAGEILGGASAILGGVGLLASAYNSLIEPKKCIPCIEVAKIFEKRTALSANLDCENCGMFCVFQYVLGVVNAYNPNKHSGLEIDFKDQGLYYDKKVGENWFNYFFQPVKIGNIQKSDVIPFSNEELGRIANSVEGWIGDFAAPGMPRKVAAELFRKYFRLKPELEKEIDQFVNQEFKNNYVIGIHYRGTDKVGSTFFEAPLVKYEEMFNKIEEHVKEKGLKEFKIFVATDEQDFLEYMLEKFGQRVIATNIARSTNGDPLHFKAKNKYEMGKGAIKDCILLSKSNFLIRTSSNLSLFSSYINPDLPILEVSKRIRYVASAPQS